MQLGNLSSNLSRAHKRSAMAASSSGNSISNSSSSFSNKPLEFSPDSPQRISLTPDQLKYCSEALAIFKEKLQTPHRISQEFAQLQVEGILVRAADELQALHDERKKVDPQTAEAIDQFLMKLRACTAGELSFTFILDDPARNILLMMKCLRSVILI